MRLLVSVCVPFTADLDRGIRLEPTSDSENHHAVNNRQNPTLTCLPALLDVTFSDR